MRSLTFKLMLAFLAISLIGAVLASVFARWTTLQEFDRLVLEQTRNNFLTDVQYLRQNLDGERAFVVELTLPHLNSGTPKAHGHYSTFTMPSTNLDRDDHPPIQSYHLCPLRHDWTRDHVGPLALGWHRW